jgi:ribonuclease kappa
MKWPICGPKLSLCCTIISVWGIIQFILLGIFFFVESAPLLDDFTIDTKNTTDSIAFDAEIKNAYHQRAYNCWIAAFLYVALLVFSGYQFRTHLKSSSSPPNIPTSVTSPFAGVTTEGNGYNSQYGIQFTGDQNDT